MCTVTKKSHTDKYNQKKIDSLTVSDCFLWAGDPNIAHKIAFCANFIYFLECAKDDFKKFAGYFSCKCRMCPFCQFRKSRKIADQVCKVAHYALKAHPTYQFLFLTLTVPNVNEAELSNTITHMFKSWHKMTKRVEVQKVLKGFFRSLEVKYNPARDDYHPHFHILLFVPGNYYKKIYIKQSRWLDLWREATKDPSITQVDIRKVKPRKVGEGALKTSNPLAGAAAEVGKYATDAKDYLNDCLSNEKKADVIMTLHSALRNRRIHSYGGILGDIKAQLNLLSVEDPNNELSDVEGVKDCFCPVCQSELRQVMYQHQGGDYKRLAGSKRPDKLVKAEKTIDTNELFEEELGRLGESKETSEAYQDALKRKIGNVQDGPKIRRNNRRIEID